MKSMNYSPDMDFLMGQVPSLQGKVSDAEWRARVDLAASYRLVARFGWDDMLSTHISARVPNEDGALLINPYGVLFEQVTASCLVKVDYHGKLLSKTPFPINPAAITIHGSILEARADVASALHMHTTPGVAVSTHAAGLMPINQRALYFQDILAYHDYEGLALESDERETLVSHLDDKWALILRNHGTLTVGRTIAQAFVYAYMLERACEYQVATLAGGTQLTDLADEIKARVPKQATHFVFAGTMEWPALLALLDKDDPSFRL
jgi:ribulose-5-phosphate 4-epimerase/fuculose-1-phosphate aldolase